MWLPTLTKSFGHATGRRALRPRCEDLEGRQLLSGITATLNNANGSAYTTGVLMINGTAGDDIIHVTQSNGNLSVAGVAINWTLPLLGTISSNTVPAFDVSQIQINTLSGNDTVRIDPGITTQALVFAGNGTDLLTTGGSNDTFYPGDGADTFVALGGSRNVIFGGVGNSAPDSFWFDGGATVYNVNATEQAAGMVHAIGQFAPLFTGNPQGLFTAYQPSNQLNGPTLPDPPSSIAGARSTNFANDPLFAAGGPSPADIVQGAANDCQFLAALLGLATKNPQAIAHMIVNLGDGTYAVDFKPNGVDTYIRVDANLPTNAGGGLIYAQLGQQNALWVGLMEKAWTYQRPTHDLWWREFVGTYGNIEGGGPGELFSQINMPAAPLNASNMWGDILNDVNAGLIVCVVTNTGTTANSGLVASHVYYADHMNYTLVRGLLFSYWVPTSVTLRNPWGGANSWVTITQADVTANLGSGISTPGHA